MAVDMFLKIQGVEGESTDDKHKNEIDVLSFSWGISNIRQQSSPGRLSPAGKASLKDFSIVKRVDRASPVLFMSSCEGSHFPEVSFTARKAGAEQQEYYKITLKEVLISSVAPGGSSQDALEQVSFAFAAAEIAAAGPDGKFESRAICGGSLSEEPPPVIIESVKKE